MVRPIRIGDILRRLLCKVLLIVVGKVVTRACGIGTDREGWGGIRKDKEGSRGIGRDREG